MENTLAPKVTIKMHQITALADSCARSVAMKDDTQGIIGLFEDKDKNSLAFYGPEDTTEILDDIKGTVSDCIYFEHYKCYFAWCAETNTVYRISEDRKVTRMDHDIENVNYLSKAFKTYKDYLFINQERGWIVYSKLDQPEPERRVIDLK